jgi:hypothetical protein
LTVGKIIDMRLLITITTVLTLACSSGFCADQLIQSSDMTYLGAFTVPPVGSGSESAQTYRAGLAIGFNPLGNSGGGSLLISGRDTANLYVGEITIPTLYTGSVSNFDSSTGLNTSSHVATFIQGSPYFWDLASGHGTEVGSGGSSPGCAGFWVAGGLAVDAVGKVFGTTHCSYEGGARLSMFPIITKTPYSNLATGTYAGNYGLNFYTATFTAVEGNLGDLFSGGLGVIPSAYQSQLGGTMLATSNGADMSNIGRTSFGPSIVAFDPANFAAVATMPETQNAYFLAGYPNYHNTLDEWYTAGNVYASIADHNIGVAMPPGSRTVLVIGQHGIGGPGLACTGRGWPESGVNCYGYTTSNCDEVCKPASGLWPAEGVPTCAASHTCNGTVTDANHACCYSPGTQAGQTANVAYPYTGYVWAYDVGDSSGNNTSGNSVQSMDITYPEKNNLTAAKLGQIDPWDLYPYAVWQLSNNYGGLNPGVSMPNVYANASFDPTSGKLYVSAYRGQNPNNASELPVIEVYQITTPDEADTAAPAVTAFTIPATYTSLTVPINSFTVADETALHESPYCVTTTNSSSGCSWQALAPTSVTFGAAGSQTAYAWARDAALNVSEAVTDSVEITLPPGNAVQASGSFSIH